MCYVLPENTEVIIEAEDGSDQEFDVRLTRDERFEWNEHVTTPQEANVNLRAFCRDGFRFCCDADDVIEIKATAFRMAYGFAGQRQAN